MLKSLASILVIVAGLAPFATAQAPYVGSYEALNNFNDITQEQMDVLRTKKILFASRSFGLNLRNGLSLLAGQDAKYNLLNSYNRWDVFSAGSDLGIIPATAFDSYNFVHFLATYWPHTARVGEVERLLTTAPWNFSQDADVVFIYFHTAVPSAFATYSAKMDTLQAAYPNIKFIYSCAGYMDVNHVADNANSDAFNAQVLAKYKNVAPVYNLAAILSRDGECGSAYCPDYSTDAAGVHPNEDAGEIAMAKGFLVILKEVFFGSTACTSTVAPTVPSGVTATPVSVSAIDLDWTESTHAECGIKYYQVRRDGQFIGSTYGNSYSDEGLEEGTEYTYTVSAVSAADSASAWSSPVSATTLSDVTAPTLVAAADTRDSTGVVLEFSEALDRVSAETAGNYSINNGVAVISASLSGLFVTLTTSAMTSGTTYMVSVSGVTDASANANPVAAGTQATFMYSPLTYQDDAIGYWAFDNTLEDASAGSVAGSWTGTPGYTTGYVGQALDLDGTATGPYVLIPNAAHLHGMDNLTISIWAKKNDAAVGGQVIKKHLVYDMTIGATSMGGYLITDSTGQVGIGASGIANNDTEWHHYCLTYDGAYQRSYLDGVQVSKKVQAGAVSTYSQGIYLGKLPWGSGLTFAGQLDEFKIFERALDSTEVVAMFSGGGTGPQPNADSLAVKALLDANGDLRGVANVAVFDSSGRITGLYLQTDLGGTITSITSHIGQLTELQLLHVYGPDGYAHDAATHLTTVDPAIANCTKLTEILFNDNDLTSLPDAITGLSGFTSFSVGNNKLCSVSTTVETWLNTNDPDWAATQSGCTGNVRSGASRTAMPFEAYQADGILKLTFIDEVEHAGLVVYDMNGTAVFTVQGFRDAVIECPLASLGHGMHVVKIIADGVAYWEKIVTTK